MCGATAFFWGVFFFLWYSLRHVFIGMMGEKSAILRAMVDALGDAIAGIALGLGVAIGSWLVGVCLRGRVAAIIEEMRVAVLDLEVALLRWERCCGS
jgi:biopolymer transport protein ExbB/TolQ